MKDRRCDHWIHSTHHRVRICSIVLILLLAVLCAVTALENPVVKNTRRQLKDGNENFQEGRSLFDRGLYDEAAYYLWQAILLHSTSSGKDGDGPAYSVQEAFLPFIECYSLQGRQIDAYLHIARESFLRRQFDIASVYIDHALAMDSQNKEALEIHMLLQGMGDNTQTTISPDSNQHVPNQDSYNNLKAALDFYTKGLQYFEGKNFALAAKMFDNACNLAGDNMSLGPACTNAIYCRTNIMDWGYNGTQFAKDMDMITLLTQREVAAWRSVDKNGVVDWSKATSVHPHMMLGYPDIDPMLKRYVAESYAIMDERFARVDSNTNQLKDLPSHLPYDQSSRRQEFILEAVDKDFKIRVGFVSSGFNAKAVLYLSHDIFRFFNPKKFELHIFSIGAPDSPFFIQVAMRGVDWRERVKSNVDFFHDVQHLKDNHMELARFIYEKKIHILIEWDGYARQGMRAQGLFALKPAPILILHQEFLGTTGGPYVDYIITDQIASPQYLENLYSEKFLYLPNHFFCKGHAMQKEIQSPTYEFKPKQTPYALGTGTPQENRCLAPNNIGPRNVSFVFCNFNKFLKNNPQTVRSWIQILRGVPDSLLCLLENPEQGVDYLRSFVNDVAVTTGMNDGDDLNSRIHFLKWESNPFDHQLRHRDFCNLVLDSHPYNGHTTAQDSLYSGVPIVTRSDGKELSSRVTTSANTVLGLEELNTEGSSNYVNVSIRLGNDPNYFRSIRNALIQTCLQRSPYHPYWDARRYTRNLETGFEIVYTRYLAGSEPSHVVVVEEDEARRGSFEVDISRAAEVRTRMLHETVHKNEL